MSTVPARRAAPPPLMWRVWPLEEGGPTAWLLALLLGGAVLLAGWQTRSAIAALLAGAVAGIAAWRYFLPVYYEVNSHGVFQTVLGRRRRISWRSIGRIELCRDGVLIAPSDSLSPALRGIYLPWGVHRAELLASIDYYLQLFHAGD
ncbi:MAG TPA: hypothetical protein VF306_15260 [Pirellulales bacterium]